MKGNNIKKMEFIYYLTIKPLEIIFETFFLFFYRFTGKPFVTIVALSVFVNFLVLPLYRHADKLQEEQLLLERTMEKRLSQIKRTFKGDEKIMMTQAYYRICDYKPIYALRGASSLLLQIPFFIAAYRFLSGLEIIKGMPSVLISIPRSDVPSSYLIDDLGSPDKILNIGGNDTNILPIFMTIINIVSGMVYSKGHPRKEKVQFFVSAIVFLVILYNSPSGLVIYWICNNVFSLCKNIFNSKTGEKNPLNVHNSRFRFDLLESGVSKVFPCNPQINRKKYNKTFIFSSFFLMSITGLFIPSNVLSSSSTEFITKYDVFNPSTYLIYTFLLGAGFFIVWIGIYYFFSSDFYKKIIVNILMVLCVCAVINYMMSGSGLGTISASLKYDIEPSFSLRFRVINIVALIIASILIVFLFKKRPIIIESVLAIGCVSFLCVSFINVNRINTDYSEYLTDHLSLNSYEDIPGIHLSRTGRNIMLIMLDRAVGSMVMYEINERPELISKFDGFTYYYDTVSFGRSTNTGSPSVFGGYEYTPYEMNKREDELLADKHNEALKVLPVLFLQNGYNVEVMDPPYAGYKESSDLSIYDEYPEIKKYTVLGKFLDYSPEELSETKKGLRRNLWYFSFMKTSPIAFQNILYDDGDYYAENIVSNIVEADPKVIKTVKDAMDNGTESLDLLYNCNYNFLDWYYSLDYICDYTYVSDEKTDNFLMMYNAASHEPMILQMPDYKPTLYVDNRSFDDSELRVMNGTTLRLETEASLGSYHVNMAALIELGKWFDYLREEGVYDNTKIIIVSEHCNSLSELGNMTINGKDIPYVGFLPLLMVKDFDSHGFDISTDLMTNADACILAVSGNVVDKAINPFTGNALDGHQKNDEPLLISNSSDWNIASNNGNRFLPSDWYVLKGTPYNFDNWNYYGHE